MAGLTVGSLVQVREAPFTTMFAPLVIPVRFVIVMLATIWVEVVMAKAEGRKQTAERKRARILTANGDKSSNPIRSGFRFLLAKISGLKSLGFMDQKFFVRSSVRLPVRTRLKGLAPFTSAPVMSRPVMPAVITRMAC